MEAWGRFTREESGQDLAEYAILIGLIALVVLAGLLVFTDLLDVLWRTVRSGLEVLG